MNINGVTNLITLCLCVIIKISLQMNDAVVDKIKLEEMLNSARSVYFKFKEDGELVLLIRTIDDCHI